MSDAMPGKRYGTLQAWRDGDVWRYLPSTPAPQRGPDGRAQLSLVEAGEMLMLTLGTTLTPTEQQLAEARASIASETGAKPDRIDLRPADATPRGATLILTLEGEPPIELARANPSPVAPHPAAFSAMLRGDHAKQATAALKAGSGRLDVVYDLDLPMTRSVTARVAGDPGEARNVEEAVAAGNLNLTYEADEGVSEALKSDARRRVLDEAQRMFGNLERPPKPEASEFDSYADEESAGRDTTEFTEEIFTSAIDAHVTRTEPAPKSLRLVASVADWL